MVPHMAVPQRPKNSDLKKELLQITERNLDYEKCKLRMQGSVLNRFHKDLPEKKIFFSLAHYIKSPVTWEINIYGTTPCEITRYYY